MPHELSENRTERGPLQFTSRTMFVVVAGCALLFAVIHAVGPLWGTAIVWLLLLVAAHVAGNLHGAHRRSSGPNDVSSNSESPPAQARPVAIEAVCAPATRLRHSKGFGWALFISTVAMALLGWFGGTIVLLTVMRAGAGGVVLGGLSTGVLGGFLGFVAGSFTMVATRAFREASQEAGAVQAGSARRSA